MTLLLFLSGFATGMVIALAVASMHRLDHDVRIFNEGRQDGREGIAPRRPVGDVPGWERRNHPAFRDAPERGMSDTVACLGGILTALVVLWLAATFGGGL